MPSCLLYRPAEARPDRFYRIELAVNLFDGVSVLREWGVAGGKGRSTVHLFNNLREASVAADGHRKRMLKRGYNRA